MVDLKVGFLVEPSTLKAQCLFDSLCKNPVFSSFSYRLITPKGVESDCLPAALSNNHRALCSNDISDESDFKQLSDLDIIVSFGWPYVVSSDGIRNLPKIINIHGGSLPGYKGGSVYLHMWAHKESSGEATAHVMTENIDDGNVIYASDFSISAFDSPSNILHKSVEASISVLIYILRNNLAHADGKVQSGGRYFYSVSKWKLVVYRLVNEIGSLFGYKLLLPHRLVE